DGGEEGSSKQTNKTIYYQPTVHQFTCRGAFHLRNQNQQKQEQQQLNSQDGDGDKSNTKPQSEHSQSTPVSNDDPEHNTDTDILDALIRDTFICNGIQSRLRHVADYPLAKSQEDAIRWFQGSDPMGVGGVEVHTSSHAHNRHEGEYDATSASDGQHGSKLDKKIDNENATIEDVEMEPYVDVIGPDDDTTFSSYGTTQVNILTTREVPVVIARDVDDVNNKNSSPFMDDPFGGFGPIAHPAGMLNPFGSLFGGFFGGSGIADHPWSQHPAVGGDGGRGEGADNNNNTGRGWMKGSSSSRSVTSTTRVEKDENGKRVVTTVTNTTIVDGDGKRRTETVTTQRHVDDGGRVETTKVVHGDDASAEQDHPPVIPPPPFPFLRPASMRPDVVLPSDEPTSPPEVAVIATDCLLGVSISDSASTDPDSFVVPSSSSSPSTGNNGKSKSGWRKTEYLFKLGRFIPPFMIVGKYYKDEEEEERRRKEMQREYNDMRDRLRKNRWDKRSSKDESEKKDADVKLNPSNTEISSNISHVSTQTEYYLQRIYVQMVKNATMMKFLCGEMMKPDFPKKVKVGGEKVLDNIGPTVERTGRLMKDVWDMWTGWVFGDDEGGSRRGGGGVGGASSRR
ncbi:hypothetical protein ACHAXH_006155, partial [Discostella pseudostelligera]